MNDIRLDGGVNIRYIDWMMPRRGMKGELNGTGQMGEWKTNTWGTHDTMTDGVMDDMCEEQSNTMVDRRMNGGTLRTEWHNYGQGNEWQVHRDPGDTTAGVGIKNRCMLDLVMHFLIVKRIIGRWPIDSGVDGGINDRELNDAMVDRGIHKRFIEKQWHCVRQKTEWQVNGQETDSGRWGKEWQVCGGFEHYLANGEKNSRCVDDQKIQWWIEEYIIGGKRTGDTILGRGNKTKWYGSISWGNE